jgi:hypothetical protein
VSTGQSVCQTCGYRTRSGPGEYHPYEFCILVKAGLSPWEVAKKLAIDLGPFTDRSQSPLASEVMAARG